MNDESKDMRRVRWLAIGLIVGMQVLFGAAFAIKHFFGTSGIARVVADALSLVGALIGFASSRLWAEILIRSSRKVQRIAIASLLAIVLVALLLLREMNQGVYKDVLGLAGVMVIVLVVLGAVQLWKRGTFNV